MENELAYINRCIQFIEGLLPSEANAAIWTMLKTRFIPRLKAYVNGEKPSPEKSFDVSLENAKKTFTGLIEESGDAES